jgi:hypothetical protein
MILVSRGYMKLRFIFGYTMRPGHLARYVEVKL